MFLHPYNYWNIDRAVYLSLKQTLERYVKISQYPETTNPKAIADLHPVFVSS